MDAHIDHVVKPPKPTVPEAPESYFRFARPGRLTAFLGLPLGLLWGFGGILMARLSAASLLAAISRSLSGPHCLS